MSTRGCWRGIWASIFPAIRASSSRTCRAPASLRGANYIYNVAPKDGTVFGTFARNMALIGQLKTNQNVQFDPRKFTWLGSSSSLANDAYICWSAAMRKVKTIEEARRPVGLRSSSAARPRARSSDAMAILLREWLGFNVKVIPGYTDSGVLFLAIERGEVEGRTVGLSAVRANKPDWLKPGGLDVYWWYSAAPRGIRIFRMRRPRASLPATREDRNLIEIIEIPYALSRPYAAPPEVPADRAKALQDAFMATQKDPAYLEEAEKLGIDISPIGAQEVLGSDRPHGQDARRSDEADREADQPRADD